MEIDPNIECNRTIARGVQTADQDADPPAFGGNRRHVVLGIARFWPDHDAQGGWLAKPRPKSLVIRSLTSSHDQITSSRWRSRQTQFQHKLRRHQAGGRAMISFQLVQGCRIKRRQHGAVTCIVVVSIGSAIGRRFLVFYKIKQGEARAGGLIPDPVRMPRSRDAANARARCRRRRRATSTGPPKGSKRARFSPRGRRGDV